MHIVVGALLIIFGVADGGTAFLGREICLQLVTGSMGLDWCMGISVRCRNSAFVRYKLTYFSPSQLLARRGKKRRENKSKLQ